MKIKSALFLLGLTILSGCAPYSESFDCTPGKGVGCKSLSTVNHMVEEGELPLEDLSKTPKKEIPPLIEAESTNKPISLLSHHSSPHALKIWLAAYEDEHGIYHAPSFIYADLKKDAWE